jgi:hypothetical protein
MDSDFGRHRSDPDGGVRQPIFNSLILLHFITASIQTFKLSRNASSSPPPSAIQHSYLLSLPHPESLNVCADGAQPFATRLRR